MKDLSFLEGLDLKNYKALKRKFGYYLDEKRERVGKNWDKLTHQDKREIGKQLDREFEQLPEGTGFGDYVDDVVNQFINNRKMK